MLATTRATYSFERPATDNVGSLPKTRHDNKFILTMQVGLTKYSHVVPIPNHESYTVTTEPFKFITQFRIPKSTSAVLKRCAWYTVPIFRFKNMTTKFQLTHTYIISESKKYKGISWTRSQFNRKNLKSNSLRCMERLSLVRWWRCFYYLGPPRPLVRWIIKRLEKRMPILYCRRCLDTQFI